MFTKLIYPPANLYKPHMLQGNTPANLYTTPVISNFASPDFRKRKSAVV